MGGEVLVRSTLGEGSVFTVRLPLRAALDTAEPAVAGAAAPGGVAALPLVDEAVALEIWGDMRDVWIDGLAMFVEHLPGHRAHIRAALAGVMLGLLWALLMAEQQPGPEYQALIDINRQRLE